MEGITKRKRCLDSCIQHQFILKGHPKYDINIKFCPKYHRGDQPPDMTFPIFNTDRCYYTSGFILGVDQKSYQKNKQQELVQYQKMVKDSLEKIHNVFPRPNDKHATCSVCKEHYDHYNKHIIQDSHLQKIKENQYTQDIKQVCLFFKQKWEGCQEKADLNAQMEEEFKLQQQKKKMEKNLNRSDSHEIALHRTQSKEYKQPCQEKMFLENSSSQQNQKRGRNYDTPYQYPRKKKCPNQNFSGKQSLDIDPSKYFWNPQHNKKSLYRQLTQRAILQIQKQKSTNKIANPQTQLKNDKLCQQIVHEKQDKINDQKLLDPRIVDPRIVDPRIGDPRILNKKIDDFKVKDSIMSNLLSNDPRLNNSVAIEQSHGDFRQNRYQTKEVVRAPSSQIQRYQGYAKNQVQAKNKYENNDRGMPKNSQIYGNYDSQNYGSYNSKNNKFAINSYNQKHNYQNALQNKYPSSGYQSYQNTYQNNYQSNYGKLPNTNSQNRVSPNNGSQTGGYKNYQTYNEGRFYSDRKLSPQPSSKYKQYADPSRQYALNGNINIKSNIDLNNGSEIKDPKLQDNEYRWSPSNKYGPSNSDKN